VSDAFGGCSDSGGGEIKGFEGSRESMSTQALLLSYSPIAPGTLVLLAFPWPIGVWIAT
jgi:hypothetical protein